MFQDSVHVDEEINKAQQSMDDMKVSLIELYNLI